MPKKQENLVFKYYIKKLNKKEFKNLIKKPLKQIVINKSKAN